MSLSDFLALQEGQAVDANRSVPSTQPSLSDEDREMIDRELGPYKVGPGDTLSLKILGVDELPKEAMSLRVDRNGEIRLVKLGSLKVAGLELEDIEQRILAALADKSIIVDVANVLINVELTEAGTTNVLVIGAATTPGLVHLRRTERKLVNALAAAGGMSDIASGQVTLKRLRRPGEQVTVNVYEPASLKDSLAMAPLENGDIVQVSAAQQNILFVGGLVTTAGAHTYPVGTKMTVLQAIAASNGLRTDVTPREATLIRRIRDRDYFVKLNLDRITTGREPNILMAAGDVLWVPHTTETRLQDWANRTFFMRIGATANYNAGYSMNGTDYFNNAARQGASGGNTTAQDSVDPFGFVQQSQALQNLLPQ